MEAEGDVLGKGRRWIVRNPGVDGETIHYQDCKDPSTGFKPQTAIIVFVFSEGNSGEGKSSYNMVPVSLSGNEVRTKAQGSDRNVEDGSEVTSVKMRTKAWSLELSSLRGKINQLSPLPPETVIPSHPLLKYA